MATGLDWLGYGAFRALEFPLQRLPARAVAPLGQLVGAIGYQLLRRRARWGRANIRIAFPDADAREVARIVRRSFGHVVIGALDLMRARRWSAQELRERVELVGLKHVESEIQRGKGLFLVSAHIGNFEIMIRRFSLEGHPMLVLGRPLKNPLVYDYVRRLRTELGEIRVVDSRKHAGVPIYRAIRQGRVVGMLADQRVKRRVGAFVPLFGVRCVTSTTAPSFALARDTGVLFATISRRGPDHHVVEISAPFAFERTGDAEADANAGATRLNQQLEARIRAHPEQWLCGTRRFRRSPDLPVDPYAPGAPEDFPLPPAQR
jgi:KDO2-lipid IV(A) lauroyltransferase